MIVHVQKDVLLVVGGAGQEARGHRVLEGGVTGAGEVVQHAPRVARADAARPAQERPDAAGLQAPHPLHATLAQTQGHGGGVECGPQLGAARLLATGLGRQVVDAELREQAQRQPRAEVLHRLRSGRHHLCQRRLSRDRRCWRGLHGGRLGLRRRHLAGRLERQGLLRLHERQRGRRSPGLLPPPVHFIDGAVARQLGHGALGRARTGPLLEQRRQPGFQLRRDHRGAAGPAVVGHRAHTALVVPRHHPPHRGRRGPEGPRHLLTGELALLEHHRDQDVPAGHVVAVVHGQTLAPHEHRAAAVAVVLDAPAATEPVPVRLRLQHARQHRTARPGAHSRQGATTRGERRPQRLVPSPRGSRTR